MQCASTSASCLPVVIPIDEKDEKVFGDWIHYFVFFRFGKFQFFPRFVPKQVIFSAILVSYLTPINSLTIFVLK